MTTRLCSRCNREKSIKGVWYLTPPLAAHDAHFVCESCYASSAILPKMLG